MINNIEKKHLETVKLSKTFLNNLNHNDLKFKTIFEHFFNF